MADKQPDRSMQEIEADIAATRSRMARTVDELAYRVNPQTLKANAIARVQGEIQQVVHRAQDKVVDPTGEPRYENIAKALGGVAATALTLGTLRRLFNRG
ncbi:DUF3618 domain-containing protein [Ornithinimicrobium pratense]|uniref:DUF3618 domain-containing protein n=1 Tax=Ornithinimicrobium pratense TaxID=2593973 RepID=A0A5J6V4G4_9MICO|nr:DUF3618 domain-containing protein [Ornithinimicrobium pratense]QFG67893.1 DUF3618 domain-containing protein [Ornithinimicrobium pratense]